MSNKHVKNFWIGFLVAAFTVGWLYWLWRQQKEVVPHPLIITRGETAIRVPGSDIEQPSPQTGATPVVEDNLEAIRGIGPVTARRLREAGIFTYSQLAEVAPEALEAIAGNTPWDPADWIAEAQALASAG